MKINNKEEIINFLDANYITQSIGKSKERKYKKIFLFEIMINKKVLNAGQDYLQYIFLKKNYSDNNTTKININDFIQNISNKMYSLDELLNPEINNKKMNEK